MFRIKVSKIEESPPIKNSFPTSNTVMFLAKLDSNKNIIKGTTAQRPPRITKEITLPNSSAENRAMPEQISKNRKSRA